MHQVDRYDKAHPPRFSDTPKMPVYGGGGSDFRPAQKYIRDNLEAESIDCIIGFTDGYIDVDQFPPANPVLWVLTDDSHTEFC